GREVRQRPAKPRTPVRIWSAPFPASQETLRRCCFHGHDDRGREPDQVLRRAVDDLSFTVQPGVVTGFLGPNGSGKSTTMRLILELDAPSSGDVTVNGKHYRDHAAPLHEVGALLEARSVHTGRSAYNHLLALAQTHGIPRRRVDELIDLVGLHDVARKRAGQFSLGMGQRLGIASALLGDPSTVMLDEPVNGLEPGLLEVHGLAPAQIGDAAAAGGVALHELTPKQASLEEAFMDLTREDVEFKAVELEDEEAVA